MRYLTLDFFGNYCNILLALSLAAFFDLLLENSSRYLNSLISLSWGSFLKIQYVINITDAYYTYILFYLLNMSFRGKESFTAIKMNFNY
jgi:hypothetical protein